MMLPRKIYPKMKSHLDRDEILVLTGLRRCGKTSLVRGLYDDLADTNYNKYFFDLENVSEQHIFDEIDFNDILHNLSAYKALDDHKKTVVFLDEIQAFPKIVPAIKYLYDHHQIKFIVTGSSSFYLKNLFSESLAGRMFLFELYPLDFEEFLWFKGEKVTFHDSFTDKAKQKNKIKTQQLDNFYEEYLLFGGFPQVVLESETQVKKEILTGIFNAYFEKDVQLLADFKDNSLLRKLIFLLLKRVGNRLDITRLASELETSRQTIYNYLEFLRATYFIHLVPVFSNSIDKQVAGSHKLYLCDNGLVTNFGLANEGELLENAVYLNLAQQHQLNYFLTSNQNEVDFIVDKKVAIEVKNTLTDGDLHTLSLRARAAGVAEYYGVSRTFSDSPKAMMASDL